MSKRSLRARRASRFSSWRSPRGTLKSVRERELRQYFTREELKHLRFLLHAAEEGQTPTVRLRPLGRERISLFRLAPPRRVLEGIAVDLLYSTSVGLAIEVRFAVRFYEAKEARATVTELTSCCLMPALPYSPPGESYCSGCLREIYDYHFGVVPLVPHAGRAQEAVARGALESLLAPAAKSPLEAVVWGSEVLTLAEDLQRVIFSRQRGLREAKQRGSMVP